MKKFLMIMMLVVILAPSIGYTSDCWEVSNLKGYQSLSGGDYQMENTYSLSMPWFLFLDNDNPRVSSSGEDYQIKKISEDTYIGIPEAAHSYLMEIYMIDREKRKLIYVKTVKALSSQEPFKSLQGALIFVGDCNPCYKRYSKEILK